MNFGYKETIKKQEDLVSIKNKVISKSKMTFVKVCLFIY